MASSLPVEPRTLKGLTIGKGVAIGQAELLLLGTLDIPHLSVLPEEAAAEILRLRKAIAVVTAEFDRAIAEETALSDMPGEAVAFLEMHKQLLQDESLLIETQNIIQEKLINAEWALSLRLEGLRAIFQSLDSAYLAERIDDISQVIERLQRALMGCRNPAEISRGGEGDMQHLILVAHHLDPADILALKRSRDFSIAGIALETGSATSHAAILARSLEIPTLAGVTGLTDAVQSGDMILLDAGNGTLTINPEAEQLPAVYAQLRELTRTKRRLRALRSAPTVTADGKPVSILANIALPEDVSDAVRNGAEGIGLFRSEFLFMNRDTLPDEEEQYEAYRRVITAMQGRRVVIRTMDIGGDKPLSDTALESLGIKPSGGLHNPSLGERAIRFCLSQPSLFKTQLRAILRAAAGANVAILLPMLSRPSEVEISRLLIAQTVEELKAEGLPCHESVPVGGMIEVPAAALSLSSFLPHLDFISLGTNDLIQYLLAVDRQDPAVSELFDPLHPAVLSLLSSTIRTCINWGKEVCVCGEIAADPLFAPILIGMGLTTLSMESSHILPMRDQLRGIDSLEAQALVQTLLHTPSPKDIHKLLNAQNPCRRYYALKKSLSN